VAAAAARDLWAELSQQQQQLSQQQAEQPEQQQHHHQGLHGNLQHLQEFAAWQGVATAAEAAGQLWLSFSEWRDGEARSAQEQAAGAPPLLRLPQAQAAAEVPQPGSEQRPQQWRRIVRCKPKLGPTATSGPAATGCGSAQGGAPHQAGRTLQAGSKRPAATDTPAAVDQRQQQQEEEEGGERAPS
jgi:hypothetical protein